MLTLKKRIGKKRMRLVRMTTQFTKYFKKDNKVKPQCNLMIDNALVVHVYESKNERLRISSYLFKDCALTI